MSNITPDESLLRPWVSSTPVAAPHPAHLTPRPAKAVQPPPSPVRINDRVSVSPQARRAQAEARAVAARPARAAGNGLHVSLERLARIKQAYEARRIRPNPQIIASHLLDERRWL